MRPPVRGGRSPQGAGPRAHAPDMRILQSSRRKKRDRRTTQGGSSMPQPNPQMQAVLDELAMLGGKPIETLTPDEARKQPTPTDAVMSLLKKQGMSAKPAPVGNVAERNIPGPLGDVYRCASTHLRAPGHSQCSSTHTAAAGSSPRWIRTIRRVGLSVTPCRASSSPWITARRRSIPSRRRLMMSTPPTAGRSRTPLRSMAIR